MRNYGDLLGKAEKLVNCGLLENFPEGVGRRVSQGGMSQACPRSACHDYHICTRHT